VARGKRLDEPEAPVSLGNEHSVDGVDVEMRVQVEAAACAMDETDGARLGTGLSARVA
jgi:hypothetical protein